MEILDIAFDFGGSGLKAVASYGGRTIAFRISPQIIEIPDPNKYLEQEFSIDLSRNLWVACPGAYFALGEFAANQYYATVPLVEPKRTYIVPRTLGAVAVAAHRFGINRFKLTLQLLLPAAEFNREGKQELKEELALALATFDTPIGQMKAKVLGFAAKPEGFGLMRRKMLLAGAGYQMQDIAVLMFGHRNTSLYLSSGGEQRHYRTNNIGFVRAIESANIDQLKAIANPRLVDKASIDSYWSANKGWLRENWPESAVTAIVGGGPIAIIGDQVTAYLDSLVDATCSTCHATTFVNGGMPLTKYEENNWQHDPRFPLLTAWPEDISITEEDKRQFADVYCLWATARTTKQLAQVTS
jgi:hypothetical protein